MKTTIILPRGIMSIIEFALRQEAGADRTASFARERFTGRFMHEAGVIDVAAFGNSLVELSADADNPVSMVTRLAVADENTLRMTEAPGFASRGAAIRYVRDSAGSVVKIITGGGSAYPLPIFLERAARG
ncbi:MAG: hypothetical protein ACRDG4_13355 [Chloroflexota bacterium]